MACLGGSARIPLFDVGVVTVFRLSALPGLLGEGAAWNVVERCGTWRNVAQGTVFRLERGVWHRVSLVYLAIVPPQMTLSSL